MAWAPARTNPHPPKQTIAAGANYDFVKPSGANGFIIGIDGQVTVTFDGTTATATNGITFDPSKSASGLVPVLVIGKLSVFNSGSQPVNVSIAWIETTG